MNCLHRLTTHLHRTASHVNKRQLSGFSFAGPRKLDEIVKIELLSGKSKAEVSDIWMTYHENKEGVYGAVLKSGEGEKILDRAKKWPFFIQPVFRDDGYFMLVSQYQDPSHFLLAYLEDYKMDPNRAQPLLTFSIFTDLDESHAVNLLRCDIINKGIEDFEGRIVMQNMIESYSIDEEFSRVKVFNEKPSKFDIDDFISCMNQKWKSHNDINTEDPN